MGYYILDLHHAVQYLQWGKKKEVIISIFTYTYLHKYMYIYVEMI